MDQPILITTTMNNTINWFVTAGTLRSAFELCKRDDGSQFYKLKETAQDLVEFVYELHDSELPNDWRYDTIISILEIIEDYNELDDDVSFEIAESLVDIYNHDLFQWYADHNDRINYMQEGLDEGLITPTSAAISQLSTGQFLCMKRMVDLIIERLKE